MNNLYSELAKVYEAMYTTFIDYRQEYQLYESFLKKYNKGNILEIGSGTGNLSQYFVKDKYEYYGLDLNHEMLKIARQKNPDTIFIQGDMRFFKLEKLVQSTIMAGRTISYLVKNEDVESTLKSIYNNMEKGGIFCFDFIDANKFIPEVSEGKIITHEASYNDITYLRESKWSVNLQNGWSFDWESIFYRREENTLVEIGIDNSTIRTYTKDEIELFLSLNQFEIREIIEKESYAFPTNLVIAEKNKWLFDNFCNLAYKPHRCLRQLAAKIFKRADIKFCFTEFYVCPFKPPPAQAAELRRAVNTHFAKFVKEPKKLEPKKLEPKLATQNS